MERLNGSPNFVEMFGGVHPSRQAANLAKRAISLGEDPTYLTQQAGIAAQRDGRSKVGFFGGAERPLNALKDVVGSLEGKKAMDESRKRIDKRNF